MKQQAGFSVTEMMIVVAIVAILLGIGVPSFHHITNSYRMSAEVNGVLGDLMYARAEAVRQGQTVTVCVSTDKVSCTGETDWAKGWIVFSDQNGNQAVDTGEVVLRKQAGFAGATPDTFLANPAVTAVTFNREGFATTTAGFAGTTITLHDPTANGVWTRCLSITAVGLMTTLSHTTDPGICS